MLERTGAARMNKKFDSTKKERLGTKRVKTGRRKNEDEGIQTPHETWLALKRSFFPLNGETGYMKGEGLMVD
jgi:hypothetical protein